MNMHAKGLRGFVGTLGLSLLLGAGCNELVEEEQGSFESEEETDAAESALVGGTAGVKTGLVVKFRDGCTGVLIPTGGSTTQWAMSAHHCTSDDTYDPVSDNYAITLQSGTSVNVTKAYPHPLAEWGITGTNSADPVGKVDVVLLKLATAVTLPVADRTFYFSTVNNSTNIYHESRRLNGSDTTTYSWLSASMVQDGSFSFRGDSTGSVEKGDSGGPVWNKSSVDTGGRLLEGIQSGLGGLVADSSGFYEWAVDGIECGVFDLTAPSMSFCSASCPCGPGEGHCDSNSECQSGLTCQANFGNRSGLPSNYSVCLESTRVASATSGYCGTIGGCQIYEGDCNSHDECKGDLICRPNAGAAIGLATSVDVCDLPRQHGWKSSNWNGDTTRKTEAANYCTVGSPCGLGEGDCDENNDATCRGYLRCKSNVGNQFGFTNNNVDVCVHPDYY